MKKILFYCDSTEIGGHELLAINAVSYLLKQPDIHLSFLIYKNNIRLRTILEDLCRKYNNFSLYLLDYGQRKAQAIFTIISWRKIAEIKSIMSSINPEIVIVVQGMIEMSSLGLVAAKQIGYKVISYIPMAHKLSQVKAKLVAIREIINTYFYQLPDGFITISPAIKQQLIDRGVKSQIIVVNNGVDFSKYQTKNKLELRQKYGFNEEDYLIAIIGRVFFKQKGHDILINLIANYADSLTGVKWLVVGDGTDLNELKALTQMKKLNNLVNFISWKSDLSDIYSLIDMVIMPSQFEGVPLVMLEAMYFEIPIAASNIDGISDILPQEWLFNYQQDSSMVTTILRIKNDDNKSLINRNKIRVINEFTMDKFKSDFYKAILRF